MDGSNHGQTDPRGMRTRKCVFEALVKLMRTKPFHDISISEICETAKIHRSTFYLHFEDKNHLITFGLSNLINDTTNGIKEAGKGGTRGIFVHVLEYRDFYRSTLGSADTKLLELFLEQVAFDFRTKGLSEYKVELASSHVRSRVCAGGFLAVISWWLSQDNPCSVDLISNEFQNVLTYGLFHELKPKI